MSKPSIAFMAHDLLCASIVDHLRDDKVLCSYFCKYIEDTLGPSHSFTYLTPKGSPKLTMDKYVRLASIRIDESDYSDVKIYVMPC